MPKRTAARVSAPPLPDTLNASQRERRERIVEAGLTLLRSQEHHQIQMKDVAAEAGVALGTVYRYFQSKDHLFAEVLAQWAGRLQTSIERRPLRGASNAERLTDVLNRSMRAFQGWPQLARVVMALESSEDPFTREIFARNMARNTHIYVESLQGLPPAIARDVVHVATSVFDLQLRQWVMGSQSIADVYDRIERAVWVLLEFSDPTQPDQSADHTELQRQLGRGLQREEERSAGHIRRR